jgi:hypothetical protein
MGEASQGILDTIQKEEMLKQQQANKEIEQQRLADALALQQQEAENSAAYREGMLANAAKTADLAERKFDSDEKAKGLGAYSAEVVARLAQVPVEQRSALLKEILTKEERFAPQGQTLSSLIGLMTPTTVKGTTYYNEAADALQVPDGAEIPKGYVSADMWKILYGDSGIGTNGSKAEKQASSYTKLKTKAAEFGMMDAPEAIANIDKLQAMKVPPSLVEDALVKASADTVYDNTFTYADMNKYLPEFTTSAGKTVKLGTYLQEAEKLGATVTYDEKTKRLNMTMPKGSVAGTTTADANASIGNGNAFINESEAARKKLGDLARSFGLGKQEQVPPTTGIEQGKTLAENRRAIEDATMNSLIKQAKSSSVSPLFNDTSASREQQAAAIQKLKEIRMQNVYAFDKKYPGLAEEYLYNQ